MIIYNTADFVIKDPTAVTLGNFDGIHLGHQKLIETIKNNTSGLKTVVFSFYPHPVAFFGQKGQFKTMLDYNEKCFVLSHMDIDYLVQYPFTKEFSSLSPEEFVDYIVEKVNCKMLVVGENYNFGKGRAGNYETLKQLGEKRGIEVIAIPSVSYRDMRVSSTRIRGLIDCGRLNDVIPMLKKPYFIISKVVQGERRGRKMDFPTINLIPSDEKLLPADGVYVSLVNVRGVVYRGVTNVGNNPTFDSCIRTVETHIIDFDGDIYGEDVLVGFYDWLRTEQKFSSMDELREQLARDKQMAMSFEFPYLNFENKFGR